MLTKPLGTTSIAIPAIGQGAGDFFWNAEIDYDQKVALLRQGVELGVNLIDTAEEYVDGVSEETVGKAIKGMRDRVGLATNFSPQHNGHQDVIKPAVLRTSRLKTASRALAPVH